MKKFSFVRRSIEKWEAPAKNLTRTFYIKSSVRDQTRCNAYPFQISPTFQKLILLILKTNLLILGKRVFLHHRHNTQISIEVSRYREIFWPQNSDRRLDNGDRYPLFRWSQQWMALSRNYGNTSIIAVVRS